MQPYLFQADRVHELERAITVVAGLDEPDPIRRGAKARALFDAEVAIAATTQLELRERARTKFGDRAATMFFTPAGLEQATRVELAEHRASRFAATGSSSVLDLCCGIGSDLAAFSRAGLRAHGVERDELTAVIARHNAPEATVAVDAAETADWRAAGGVFIDPARRGTSGRTFDPRAFSPSLGFVAELLESKEFAAAKLAPGIQHQLIPPNVEAEWVSFDGGVKETVLWSTGFSAAIRRRATVMTSRSDGHVAQLTDRDREDETVGSLGAFLYEPDGAVIRAGLVTQVVALLRGGRRLDPQIAYLASDEAVDLPFARGYRVIEQFPYSVKRLRDELRRRAVGIVEIKKRGVDIDPASLRRELRLSGDEAITVILIRIGHSHQAVLAERMTQPSL